MEIYFKNETYISFVVSELSYKIFKSVHTDELYDFILAISFNELLNI